MDKSKLYRSIPKVDVLLADEEIQGLVEAYSRETVMEAIRSETDALRAFIGACQDEEEARQAAEQYRQRIDQALAKVHQANS